eukprot:CCRYP_002680-RA/>CCRYP_002680-RA protein AED:0.45 eAED:0.71 QI:0/0/0/1/0/0/2/0/87
MAAKLSNSLNKVLNVYWRGRFRWTWNSSPWQMFLIWSQSTQQQQGNERDQTGDTFNQREDKMYDIGVPQGYSAAVELCHTCHFFCCI